MKELKQRKRTRLKSWNYSSVGYYFITICSHEKRNIFGSPVGADLVSARSSSDLVSTVYSSDLVSARSSSDIVSAVNSSSNSIVLSDLGETIKTNWEKIPVLYENIEPDQYVIMPNHIHGILIVNPHTQSRADLVSAPTISQIIQSYEAPRSRATGNSQ